VTDKPVSRQRAYQLRKVAEGLCALCGRGKIVMHERCQKCLRKMRKRMNYGKRRKTGIGRPPKGTS
jgi:hypothetical protein